MTARTFFDINDLRSYYRLTQSYGKEMVLFAMANWTRISGSFTAPLQQPTHRGPPTLARLGTN
jgi:hypothetical protein